MKKLTMLAGVSLLVLASSAFAEQTLTETQMDRVSAGAAATGDGWAWGVFQGDNISSTLSNSFALAYPTGGVNSIGWAVGHGDNTTVSTSYLGFAGANSQSSAFAAIQ